MSKRDELRMRRLLRESIAKIDKVGLEKSGAFGIVDKALETASADTKSTLNDKLLPLLLLQDLLDATTLEQCPAFIEYIEQNRAAIKNCLQDHVHPRLALLGLCKKLTGRLCQSKDTLLYGKVMLLLSSFFDMFERSGLNLQGEVNAIETQFESEEISQLTLSTESLMDLDKGQDVAAVQYDFYKLFWSFQQYFVQPQLLPDKLEEFVADCQSILKEFDANLAFDRVPEETPQIPGASPDILEPIAGEDERMTLPKYLTSRRLMNLQLRDGTFRRYVLVQILMLIHSLKQYRQGKELTTPQFTKVDNLGDQVVACLKRIPPNGELFVKCVLHALKRENNWMVWKQDKCPDIKARADPSGGKLLEAPISENEKKRWRLGHPDLTKMWDEYETTPDNIAMLAKKGLTMDSFVQEYRDQIHPESGVEKKYHLSRNRLYVWRSLRMFSRQNLMSVCKTLNTVDKPIHDLFEKIVKDMDGNKEEEAADTSANAQSTKPTETTQETPNAQQESVDRDSASPPPNEERQQSGNTDSAATVESRRSRFADESSSKRQKTD